MGLDRAEGSKVWDVREHPKYTLIEKEETKQQPKRSPSTHSSQDNSTD